MKMTIPTTFRYVLLMLLLLCIPCSVMAQALAPADKPVPNLAWLELSGKVSDAPATVDFEAVDPASKLQNILKHIRKLADDPNNVGLVIYLNGADLKLTQAQQLYDALIDLRANGHKVLVFSETYDLMDYALASAADKILLQYKGQVMLQGLASEELYLKDVLEKVGIKADFYQHGKYKGADEQLTRVGPSEAWDQNINALLDDLYAQIIDMIAKGRIRTREQIEKDMSSSWTLTDEQLVEHHIVDDLTVRSLVAVTGELFGDDFHWTRLFDKGKPKSQRMENPLTVLSQLFGGRKAKTTNRPTLAILHMAGPIVMGRSNLQSPAVSFSRQSTVGSHTMIDILHDITDDPNIKGIVIRINSPGGSAMASELIWQSVQLAGMSVPVYVSVDRMAASGGYYIASAASRIYANPGSILGSIGVIAGKITLGGLYEKLGVHITRRTRGPMGDLFNSAEPFTHEQQQVLTKSIRLVYEQFLDRIKTGRPDKIADINAVAQGRLFTGRQAVANGLADKVGNLTTALTDMASDLNLAEGSYDIAIFPPPMSLGDYLHSVMGQLQVQAPNVTNVFTAMDLLAVINPQLRTQAQELVTSMMLMQSEPVLTLMPVVITIR
jgi:protease-4